MRVLVTGEADAGGAVERALRRRGHVVARVRSVEAAWDVFKKEAPKLVVLAEEDEAGRSLCRRLRRGLDGTGPWILGLVPTAAPERLEAFLEAGVDDVLLEPFDAGALDVRLALAEHRAVSKAPEAPSAQGQHVARILESITDAFFAVDHAWHFTYVNRQAEELLRISREKLLGQHMWTAFPEVEDTLFEEQFRKAAREQVPVRFEAYYPPLDIWFRVHAYPYEEGLSVYFSDITERKQDERRLAIQYATANILTASDSLAEAAPRLLQLICEQFDWDWGELWMPGQEEAHLECTEIWHKASVSLPRFEAATHQTAFACAEGLPGAVWEEKRPKWVPDVTQHENFVRVHAAAEAGMKAGFAFPIQLGERIFGVITFFSRDIREPDEGLLQMFSAIGSQIGQFAERRQTKAALRESEARVRTILETTVDGIITIDERGRIESFNRAAEKIFGYDDEEVIGENIKVLMPEPYRSEHDDYLRNYRETGRRKIIGIGREVVGRRKDGSTFPMDLAVSEVQVGGKRIFTGIVRDISERRRLEQEVLEMSDQERRRIGQDLHDGLGQTLTGIGLISKNLARRLAKRGVEEASEVAEISELIQEADQQARMLSRSLVPVEVEAKGLSAALQHLSANAERLFGVECAFEETGDVRVHDISAAGHLYRIAQEAVSNAVRHGRASNIAIGLAAPNGRVRLRVKDNGVGFPEELPEERGMGVRIMHYRARIIGASLEIFAEEGSGTAVTCTLPREDEGPRAYDEIKLRSSHAP